ncbi:MAG TPA: hypothetical protein VNW73_03240, partial [Ktedonobacteraceae bacterium]|nr:hypothetical protein [Ktedonobacteraceae bacterium]
MRLVFALGTSKQLPPFLEDALASSVGEPLPQSATSRAVLTGSVWIDFDRDNLLGVRFVTRMLSDLAAQHVSALAVHATRCAAPASSDFAQMLKEQKTARITGADSSNDTGHLVRRVCILSMDMQPELPIAMFPYDWLAREPLFPGNSFEMPIAVSVEPMISYEDGFSDDPFLTNRN